MAVFVRKSTETVLLCQQCVLFRLWMKMEQFDNGMGFLLEDCFCCADKWLRKIFVK